MEKQGTLSQWLAERCKRERLSLRQAAAKTGLSHATIQDIIKGGHPNPETVRKLAQAFGGDGKRQLEDYLLVLAGHRSKPEGELTYLSVIPLLSPEHQHVVKIVVRELARVEGIKAAVFRKGGS